MLKQTLTTAAALLASATASAQDLTVTAPSQQAPTAIVNATIHTVSGETIDRGYVLFDQGKIVEVKAGDAAFTAITRLIDAEGKHVYPGLFGAVTRLGLAEISAVRASRDFNEVGQLSPEVYAAVSVNPDSTLIPVARTNGVLLAGSFPSGGLVPGRASVLQLEGWTSEDMTLEPHAGVVINWPFQRPRQDWWMDQNEQEQLERIARNNARIDGLFQSAIAYHNASESTTDLRLEAIGDVLPTSDNQKPVFINAQDLDQITTAVEWAVGLGLKPVIVGGRDAPLAAELLKAHDVPVIVTGSNGFPKRADAPYDDAFTLPARLQAAGVRFCIASGEETGHERNLPYNAAIAAAYGSDLDFTPEDALRAITLAPAQILGVADKVGSIEPGKHATLLITDGSPLEYNTTITHAFIEGRDVDLSNKQTELRDKYLEKYRQIDGDN